MKSLRRFWRRITDGMALSQLWSQFHADALFSYRLYSQEIDSRRMPGVGRVRHVFRMVKLFLWAIFDKLTPARRVILLIALILLISKTHLVVVNGKDRYVSTWQGGAFWGGILLFILPAEGSVEAQSD